MEERHDIPLAELTTLRIGGPARRLVEAAGEDETVEAVGAADARGEQVLVLAGGSNLVVADGGFDGTVVRITGRGVAADASGSRLTVQAGEPWDGFVESCVRTGLRGVECLSGIPGSTGATPIQNVGAYGQEVADTIVSVRAYDRRERRVVELTPRECRFGYRSSALRGSRRHVVLAVTFELERSALGAPVRHAQLAELLGVAGGERAPLGDVRDAVLVLRRSKGMVVDPGDPDSVSAGSFFKNPLLDAERFAELERRVAERLGVDVHPPAWPADDGLVKSSAAWLIERAGFEPGYGNGRVGISRKHSLALVNRGGGSAEELVALAREVRNGVVERFGVALEPEPVLVGVEL